MNGDLRKVHKVELMNMKDLSGLMKSKTREHRFELFCRGSKVDWQNSYSGCKNIQLVKIVASQILIAFKVLQFTKKCISLDHSFSQASMHWSK